MSALRSRAAAAPHAAVAAVLEGYGSRGLLQPVRAASAAGGHRALVFRWFRGREFRLRVDVPRGRLWLEGVLENVAPRCAIDRELRAWLRSRQAPGLPAHRRIDPALARLSARNRAGSISILLQLHERDWARGARALLHLLNELYLDFLPAPPRFEWLVEHFELDPEAPRWP